MSNVPSVSNSKSISDNKKKKKNFINFSNKLQSSLMKAMERVKIINKANNRLKRGRSQTKMVTNLEITVSHFVEFTFKHFKKRFDSSIKLSRVLQEKKNNRIFFYNIKE